MTFGLLEAVIGVKIPEELLVIYKERDEKFVLSGARISRIMYIWRYNTESALDGDALLQRAQDVAQLFRTTFSALEEEGRLGFGLFLRAGVDDGSVQRILGAVSTFIVALRDHAIDYWKIPSGMVEYVDPNREQLRQYHSWIREACKDRLVRAGWCPNTVSDHALINLGANPRIIMALVRLEPPIREHLYEHQKCTEDACEYYTVMDINGSKPCHVDPSCVCAPLVPQFEDIEELLSGEEGGPIPVVVFDGEKLTVRASVDTPYVAISHVWADGLGSTSEEGLPTCQVARISTLARRLVPEGAFWIDSLCIPANKEYRKQAIKHMARTYKEADIVLVIDATIRVLCSQSEVWETNLLRIATSPWMRRVWTAQEGLLARKLYFEFSDGPVDVERAIAAKRDKLGDLYQSFVTSGPEVLEGEALFEYVGDVPIQLFTARAARNQERLFDDVIRLLALRRTTKEEDETIAISSLVPTVDVDALLSIEGPKAAERRMKAFLQQLGRVPKRFPMMGGPKLDLPGFRWAPRSLTQTLETASSIFGTATCTVPTGSDEEEGLRGHYVMSRLERTLRVSREEVEAEFFLVFVSYGDQVYHVEFDRAQRERDESLAMIDFNVLLHAQSTFPAAPGSPRDDALFVAVRLAGGDGDGTDEREPLRCEFVVSGRTRPIDNSLSQFNTVYPERLHIIEEVREAHVLLT